MSPLRRAGRRRRRGLNEVPWLLAVPALAALFAIHLVPIAFGSYYTFTDWNGVHANWIGLRNFSDIAGDEFARDVLWHTLLLAACFVVLVNAFGLALALGLNRAVKRGVCCEPSSSRRWRSARLRSRSCGNGSSPKTAR